MHGRALSHWFSLCWASACWQYCAIGQRLIKSLPEAPCQGNNWLQTNRPTDRTQGKSMDYPYDVGPYSRKVTTASPDAQRWFDRGLNWCFGFHHEEAIRCFEKALEADPNCAMAQWGIGYAAGPNYNFPWELMDPGGKAAALGRAYDATHAALALAANVSTTERALIEALPARYPQRDP